MKPIKLVMNAFGPYPNEEVIDFSVLKDNNLFLISGPTGAGKTTIFDAMSFALFGVANGEQRNNDSLRSQFSKDEVLTQVTLEFMIKGIKYEINRIPNQIKPKRKGEGFTTQNSDATLKIFNFDDVKVIVGVKNVNDKINEVLGLDCEQFKQIMMIPQGEFRKLLVSDSVDREKILQKLFDTKRYKNIQDKLKSEE
ncbi:MAG: SMC family ATPase, partial [Bacillota bacterium]|nr:SMC family ATPase [Bacillota bacterium]